MQSRISFVAFVALAGAMGAVWAQTQSTSSSSSQNGQSTASASSSARVSSSGGQTGSGGGNGMALSMAKPTHVILYSGGENWIPGKPAVEQNLRPHAEYMAGLMKKGILLLGGSWRDEPGGMAVLKCRSDEEAQAVLDHDPAVQGKVMQGELRAWTVYFQGTGYPTTGNAASAVRPPQ